MSEARPSGRARQVGATTGKAASRPLTKTNPRKSQPASLDTKRIKIVKKPRDSNIIEAEITEVEKRLADLSAEMAKPEVARDITKLVKVNDDYQQSERRLAELMDEWERAETAVSQTRRR